MAVSCCRLLLALLAASAAAVAVEARWMPETAAARQLLLNINCPAGCDVDNGGCVLDATSGGYRCTKCLNSLVPSDADGTCGCPAGRYATANDCADCTKGNWCAGGNYTAADSPGQTPCGGLLTTIGLRSTSIKACVNDRGSFYTLDNSGNPGATTCPVDTYGPGLKKQRACVPCAPGYTTNNRTGSIKASACGVPAGYYLKGPGQVAPCPKGEYKVGFGPAAACIKCAAGVTTEKEASTSDAACTYVLPGYYPETVSSGVVTSTQKCPQKYYCAGGQATAAFDVTAVPPVPSTANTVAACANETWTQGIGATDASQCMTPPGYKTSGGTTEACGDGSYRAEWKVPSQAASCDSCGDGIQSDAVDQITAYAITRDATASSVDVRASAAACYIKPGQGMYYSAASKAFKGVNCDTNNYGAANKTYGLAAFPCRDCPAGMQTSTSLPNSALYWSTDNGSPTARQGFTSPMACVTKAGYGYNGRVANKCPAGSWNPAGMYGTCTQCGVGLSTKDDADSQVSSTNCTIAPGYGFHDNVIQLCPVGFYNKDLRNTTTDACTPCGDGLTTSQAGGSSLADCNVCAAGWGGANCGTQCGGSAATYGPAGQAKSSSTVCEACPTMSVGFSFDYLSVNQPFTPASVARSLADNAGDCLAEFAQIVDSAWYLPSNPASLNASSAASFADCVTACQGNSDCQYITFDYAAAAGSQCWLKAKSGGPDVVAFKAVVSGDSTAASLKKKTKAKGLASGAYTFWQDNAGGIGTQTLATAATVQQCLDACDAAANCAAVVMTGLTSSSTTSSTPGACSLVTGDVRVAQFKRTVTRAAVGRLSLASAFA